MLRRPASSRRSSSGGALTCARRTISTAYTLTLTRRHPLRTRTFFINALLIYDCRVRAEPQLIVEEEKEEEEASLARLKLKVTCATFKFFWRRVRSALPQSPSYDLPLQLQRLSSSHTLTHWNTSLRVELLRQDGRYTCDYVAHWQCVVCVFDVERHPCTVGQEDRQSGECCVVLSEAGDADATCDDRFCLTTPICLPLVVSTIRRWGR